jgi:putative Holliday junction resolvase
MPDGEIRPEGTVLGFDFGHRRIGVAVGQTLTRSATALTVVSVSGKPDWQVISQLVNEWKPSALVVGLPLGPDGEETDISADARRFGRQLNGRFGLPVFHEDERLTSQSVENIFAEARRRGIARRKDAGQKDAVAAQLILQSWLQGSGG